MSKPYLKIAPLILALLLATSAALPSSAQTQNGGEEPVIGTIVRFTSQSTWVDVTIRADSPAVRDFLSMLPLTLTLEEHTGREKIGTLPRALTLDSSPGSDPENGDLIYFVPWGNLGFYYNAEGIGYSDQTLHIGTYEASPEQLEELEGTVSIEVVP